EGAFEVCRADDGDDHVGRGHALHAAREDVTSDLLVDGGGVEAVEAGEVYEARGRLFSFECPQTFLALDRDARVVSDLLAETGERVEEAGLTRVGVAGQRHDQLSGPSPDACSRGRAR